MAIVDSHLARMVSAVLIVCVAALNVPVVVLADDSPAAGDLKQIQYKYYFRGKYTEAIEVLTTFLARTDVEGSTAVSAREFLAASYILSGSPDRGKNQFLILLNENGKYAGPDPDVFKAEVIDAFKTTRDALLAVKLRTAPDTSDNNDEPVAAVYGSSRPIYKKWWFYAGLAAAALVIAAAAAPGGDEEPAASAPTGTVAVGVQIQ